MTNKPNRFDKYVALNWKPPAGLADRKPGMLWSDRIWHWLVSLGGLAIVGCGVGIIAYLHSGRLGGGIIALGLVTFVLGFPSQAQRNGYRE